MKIKIAGMFLGMLATSLTVAGTSAQAQAGQRAPSKADLVQVVQLDLGATKLVKIKARITPRKVGAPVRLQVLNGSLWHNLDSARTNRGGRVLLEGSLGEGEFTVRVFAPRTPGVTAAASRFVAVRNLAESGGVDPVEPVVYPDYPLAEARAAILEDINAYRASYGVGPLELDVEGSRGTQAQIEEYVSSGGRHDLPNVVDYVVQATGSYPNWASLDGCYGGATDPYEAFGIGFRYVPYLMASQTHVALGFMRAPDGGLNGYPYALSMYFVEKR